jgi:curved DNA-binding protein CbpA
MELNDDEYDNLDLIYDYLVNHGLTHRQAGAYDAKAARCFINAERSREANGFILKYYTHGENTVYGQFQHALINEINNAQGLMAFIDDGEKMFKYAYNFLKDYSITEQYIGGKLNLKLSDKTKKMMKNVGIGIGTAAATAAAAAGAYYAHKHLNKEQESPHQQPPREQQQSKKQSNKQSEKQSYQQPPREQQPRDNGDYDTLGVNPNATLAEVRSAYKKKALKLHPDRGGNQEDFQNLGNAYDRVRVKLGGRIRRRKQVGGSLSKQEIKSFLKNSYSMKQPKELHGYYRDNELSGQRAQVYNNPTENKTVISHRGTKKDSLKDWSNNLSYLFNNYGNTDRYKHAKNIQDKAEKKYKGSKITTIGHSQGSVLADKLGTKGDQNVITYNRPISLYDLLTRTSPKYNTDIRTSGDIVSIANPLSRSKGKKITIKSKTMDPIHEHNTDRLEDLDDDMIGSGIKSGAFTKQCNDYNKKHHQNLSLHEFALYVLDNKGFKEITKKRARFYLNFNQNLHGGGSTQSAQSQPETRKEIIKRIINDIVYYPDNIARYEYIRDRMRIGWENHIVHIINLALPNANMTEQQFEERITGLLNALDQYYSRPENDTPRDEEDDEINTPRTIQDPNLHGAGNQISEMIDNISGRNRIRPERIPEENQRARRVRVQPEPEYDFSSVHLRNQPTNIESDYTPINTTDEYILHWLSNKRHGREFRKEYNRDRNDMIKRVQRKIRSSRRRIDRDNVWWAINQIDQELDERVAREMER